MSSSSQKRYIIRESLVSLFFNSAFSFGITYLSFNDELIIPGKDLLIDALPQSFFVAFFGTLIPTLLTRKRLRKGTLSTKNTLSTWLPFNAFFRAVSLGFIAVTLGVLGHYLAFLIFNIEQLPFSSVILYKTLYGAVLTAIVSPYALHIVLCEKLRTSKLSENRGGTGG